MGRWAGRIAMVAVLGFLGLAVVFAVFLIRFDPDHYRPYLESQLSKALHFKVELGPLSRSWNRGLGVRVNGLQLRKNQTSTPLLRADSVLLWLNPLSLVGGRLAYKVRIEGGDFRYQGETKTPLDLKLEGIQAELRQEIPGGRIEGEGEGRVFSDSASDLTWQGNLNPKGGEVNFGIHLQKNKAFLQGEAFPFQKPPRFQAKLELREMDLAAVFRLWKVAHPGGEEPLAGLVSGNFEAAGVGQNGIEIRKSLQAQGELEIRDGVFRNFNVIPTVLRRMTLVPALGEALIAEVPPVFQPLFNRRDTTFEWLQAKFVVQDDKVSFQRLFLKDRHYLVEAEGTLSFQGEVHFGAKLVLMEEVSQFLVGRVKELSVLQNAQGRMVIPFVYRGTWPEARPRPDLGSLAERLLVEQGAHLLERGLEALSQQLGKPASQ